MLGFNGGFLFPKRDKRLIELDKLDDDLEIVSTRSDSLTYLDGVLREDEESERELVLSQLAKEFTRIIEIQEKRYQLIKEYRDHISTAQGIICDP
ncbi:MAG: hypothetical protein EKK63_17670 [Acinetobacter sp.]|uniref:hypothetical protein n=1 Tax=Acinetobacter sp. TaxID=472 RepID=UPI000F9F893B|nr:hypothetical protein [Acinetobacter sp.]RUP36348.1 MAG: hypothetical protein EKK63_17670 [Acinetobacter sp.]